MITSTEPQEMQERAALQAAEIFQHLVFVRASLPKILAGLIDAGREKEALAAMVAWGKGTKSIDVIWQEVAEANAPVGNSIPRG
ncbi:MAG: hypothetical protein NC238_09015 [Dehalobacter sp.]|nr:hypothetical protein [Dehalobacter sp.]